MSGQQPALSTAGRELTVWLEGAPAKVGTLSGGPTANDAVTFTYDASYLDQPNRVPLSAALPLRTAAFPDAETRTFFDNLLPEGERRRTEALANRLDPTDVVGLLEIFGRECPGAICIVPLGQPPTKMPCNLDQNYEPLSETQLASLIEDASEGRPTGQRVRFSLAGVQEKIALARDPASGAYLLPQEGAATTRLLKVEPRRGAYQGIVANEALCLSIFHRLGLPAVRAQRSIIGELQVLEVVRYDRVITAERQVKRLHQEDAAQALNVPRELKYEDEAERAGISSDRHGFSGLLGRFAGLTRGPGNARVQLVKAAQVNWLLGNSDAHLKNFAIEHGGARAGRLRAGEHISFGFDLAPFYDIVCVAAFPNVDQTLAMRIGKARHWDEVERDDWLTLAAQTFPERRVAPGILARQLDWLKSAATQILPALDAAVAEGIATQTEAKPIRDVVGQRIKHLNRTLSWDIYVDTDAPIRSGGGWLMS